MCERRLRCEPADAQGTHVVLRWCCNLPTFNPVPDLPGREVQARACSVDQVLLGWYRIPRTIDEPVQLVRGPPAPRFARYGWWCLHAEVTKPAHASGALRVTCCKA